MFISDGNSTNKFTLYPLARTIIEIENEEWVDDDDDDDIQLVFTIEQVREEDQI